MNVIYKIIWFVSYFSFTLNSTGQNAHNVFTEASLKLILVLYSLILIRWIFCDSIIDGTWGLVSRLPLIKIMLHYIERLTHVFCLKTINSTPVFSIAYFTEVFIALDSCRSPPLSTSMPDITKSASFLLYIFTHRLVWDNKGCSCFKLINFSTSYISVIPNHRHSGLHIFTVALNVV